MHASKAEADTPPRQRDAARTRQAILDAAMGVFAAKGLDGARVDEIAEAAGANKRMIYYYFGGKSALFTAVLEEIYAALCRAGGELDLDALPPDEALDALCGVVFGFYRERPEAITLLNNENMHGARHLARSERLSELELGFEALLGRLLERGVEAGCFRAGIDPVRLYLTIVSMCYFYLGNNATLSLFFGRELGDEAAMAAWLDHIRTVVRRFAAS